MREIKIDIDFAGLYATFTREAKLQASIIFDGMRDSDCAEMMEKRDSLRQVQSLLAPINIALQCATNIEKIQEMRVWLAEIVTTIQARADALENGLNNRANVYQLCYTFNGREHVETEFEAINDEDALRVGPQLQEQIPTHRGAAYYIRNSQGERIGD